MNYSNPLAGFKKKEVVISTESIMGLAGELALKLVNPLIKEIGEMFSSAGWGIYDDALAALTKMKLARTHFTDSEILKLKDSTFRKAFSIVEEMIHSDVQLEVKNEDREIAKFLANVINKPETIVPFVVRDSSIELNVSKPDMLIELGKLYERFTDIKFGYLNWMFFGKETVDAKYAECYKELEAIKKKYAFRTDGKMTFDFSSNNIVKLKTLETKFNDKIKFASNLKHQFLQFNRDVVVQIENGSKKEQVEYGTRRAKSIVNELVGIFHLYHKNNKRFLKGSIEKLTELYEELATKLGKTAVSQEELEVYMREDKAEYFSKIYSTEEILSDYERISKYHDMYLDGYISTENYNNLADMCCKYGQYVPRMDAVYSAEALSPLMRKVMAGAALAVAAIIIALCMKMSKNSSTGGNLGKEIANRREKLDNIGATISTKHKVATQSLSELASQSKTNVAELPPGKHNEVASQLKSQEKQKAEELKKKSLEEAQKIKEIDMEKFKKLVDKGLILEPPKGSIVPGLYVPSTFTEEEKKEAIAIARTYFFYAIPSEGHKEIDDKRKKLNITIADSDTQNLMFAMSKVNLDIYDIKNEHAKFDPEVAKIKDLGNYFEYVDKQLKSNTLIDAFVMHNVGKNTHDALSNLLSIGSDNIKHFFTQLTSLESRLWVEFLTNFTNINSPNALEAGLSKFSKDFNPKNYSYKSFINANTEFSRFMDGLMSTTFGVHANSSEVREKYNGTEVFEMVKKVNANKGKNLDILRKPKEPHKVDKKALDDFFKIVKTVDGDKIKRTINGILEAEKRFKSDVEGKAEAVYKFFRSHYEKLELSEAEIESKLKEDANVFSNACQSFQSLSMEYVKYAHLGNAAMEAANKTLTEYENFTKKYVKLFAKYSDILTDDTADWLNNLYKQDKIVI